MRSRNSFINMLVNTASGILLPLLGFFKVRLFIDLYGTQINGMQLFFSQIIVFANLIYIAYGIALRQQLFAPLARKDTEAIKRIHHSAVHVIKKTTHVMVLLGIVLTFIVPFFTDIDLPQIEIMFYFALLYAPMIYSFYIKGPNFVVIADQLQYKINLWIQGIALLRMIVMILLIKLGAPFAWILVVEGLNIVIADTIARKIAFKLYPYLLEPVEALDVKPFWHNSINLIIHRFATTLISNVDSIIINFFLGVSFISYYGAYSYVTDSLGRIINSVIYAPFDSFGNLFSQNEKDPYEVFREFLTFTTFSATLITAGLFAVLNEFVLIWIGQEDYVFPWVTTLLFSLGVFYATIKEPILIVRDTNGLFKIARNNAILMAIVKLVLSLILVTHYGINGILLASLIAYWGVDFLYNPILVFRRVFKKGVRRYYAMILTKLMLLALIMSTSYFLHQYLTELMGISFKTFLIKTTITGSYILLVTTGSYTILFSSFRLFLKRFKSLFRKEETA